MNPIVQLIILIVIFFLIFSGITITFKPFKIEFKDLFFGISLTITVIGISLLILSSKMKSYEEGYKKGLKSGNEILMDSLDKAIKETQSNNN